MQTHWWDRIPKKLIALAVGAAVQLIPGLSSDTKREIAQMVIGYLVGQGIADHGKEKAKREAADGGSAQARTVAAIESMGSAIGGAYRRPMGEPPPRP